MISSRETSTELRPTLNNTMTSIYGFNSEKSAAGFADIYLLSIVLGCVFAFVVIAAGLGIKFLVGIAIKYWLWVIGILALCLIIKYFYDKRSKK